MVRWLRRRKLISLVERLAIYNDKGISWSGHTSERSGVERQRLMHLISRQIEAIGRESVSPALVSAMETGELENDDSGKFITCAKETRI
jgi:hypothetical protein